MRYIIFLLPLMTWAILPQSEMEQIYKKYQDTNQSSISTHTYKDKDYYIIMSVEEKLFSDDTLEEEKIYLKTGINQVLFKYMNKKYPKMISIEVSELLHGTFGENKNFYHHIAQVRIEFVKPVFSKKTTEKPVSLFSKENNITATKNKKTKAFTIKYSDARQELKKKIEYLEDKSEKYPSNLIILHSLSRLYKQIGDTEGYADINERIMDAKMNI